MNRPTQNTPRVQENPKRYLYQQGMANVTHISGNGDIAISIKRQTEDQTAPPSVGQNNHPAYS